MDEGRSDTHDRGSSPSEETRVDAAPLVGLAGRTLCDRYQLRRLIGSGGMAQVWEATDRVLHRSVAVKVLHPHLAEDAALVARFRQEAVAAARLSHPGIVGVYDTCSDDSGEAIVMELLDAATLRQHLDEHGTLDADTTVRMALRLLDALEAAHRAGLVHRDVKPSNILLCRDGRVKIADFGIAKTDDATELTQEGTLVGTASYLAPEQLLNQTVDGRTDLYSLGIVLYECLTGRTPFQGDSSAAVAVARLHSDPVDPRQVRADVPARVAEPIMRVLQRRAEDRYASAADLRAALLDTGARPTSAPPLPEPEATDAAELEEESFARSERGWLVPALFILLVATAIVVAGLLLRDTANGDDDPAGPAGERDPVPLVVESATAFDPQGRGEPGENDELTDDVLDSDPTTSWRTESYDTPTFFGSKTGVGLVLNLDDAATLSAVEIDGSTNGWDASIHVVPAEQADTGPDDLDVAALPAVAELTDVRGPVRVDLPGESTPTGRAVLVWITDLGDVREDGRHRVEISAVTVLGVPGTG